jgi:hypothetical protein
VRLFLELREPREHQLEHAAELAGAHHVHVEIVEDARVLREPLRKRAAALHRIGQIRDRFLQTLSRSCFASTVSARSSGRPASINVAS